MRKKSGTEKRKRTEQINVRLTLDELMAMADKALDAGFISIPEYLRHVGLNG